MVLLKLSSNDLFDIKKTPLRLKNNLFITLLLLYQIVSLVRFQLTRDDHHNQRILDTLCHAYSLNTRLDHKEPNKLVNSVNNVP